jgi:hypothetical protein
MRIATWIGTAGLALLGSAAAAQDIAYDYDRSVDFAAFHTYAWVRGTVLNDELNHRRIVAAVDSQLKLKGLRLVAAADSADVLVAYHASFNRDLEIRGFSSGWGGYRFGGNRSGSARVDHILVGTLIVDLVEARGRTIVWRGSATKEIDVDASPERRERNIHRAVERIFKNYPPKS